NLHASFQFVYAFQQPRDGSIGQWAPPSEAQLNEWAFFDDRPPLELPVSGQTAPGYKAIDLKLDPLRIVVVTTLALCTERNDFDPGGALGGARLYPMIMLVSNQPLEEMRAQVELVRPAKNGMKRMKDDEMTSTIAPLLFTDHNEARSIPLVVPRW